MKLPYGFISFRLLILAINTGVAFIIIGLVFFSFQLLSIQKSTVQEVNCVREAKIQIMFSSAEWNRFALAENRNYNFYHTGFDLKLSEMRQLLSGAGSSLLPIAKVHPELADSIKVIHHLIKQYIVESSNLQKLYKIKGFKDEGYEGEMRKYAHQIENSDHSISENNYLKLRRHEKDFLLRKDTLYYAKFKYIADSLLKNGLVAADAVSTLHSYHQCFDRLVQIELKMGTFQHKGVKNKMEQIQTHLLRHIHILDQKINILQEKEEAKTKTILSIVVISGLILLIFFAFWLPNWLYSPIKNMHETVRNVVESGFVKPIPENLRFFISEFDEQARDLKLLTNELENKLKKVEEQKAKLSSSLKVKDTLFSVISHDLRGPLSSLKGMLYLFTLDPGCIPVDELKMHASQIDKSVEQMLRLLSNILAWSRSELGVDEICFEKRDVRFIVESGLDLLSSSCHEKNISVDFKVEGNTMIECDEKRVDTIFRNLLNNAIKYSYKDSNIRIVLKGGHESIELCIQDNGIGISERKIHDLLQGKQTGTTFGTMKEKGTGLGMILIRAFVKDHLGEFSIVSELNKGTKVCIRLPNHHSTLNKKEDSMYQKNGHAIYFQREV